VWLKHYLNESSSVTFLNSTASAIAAKYNAKSNDSFRNIGCQNFTILSDKIELWLDETGLSENFLKLKLRSLIDAKQTKFFHAPVKDEKGQVVDILVKEVEVEAIETQRKTLDMALKVRGMNAPEKREHSGPGGGPIETKLTDFPKEPETIADWEQQRLEAEESRKAIDVTPVLPAGQIEDKTGS